MAKKAKPTGQETSKAPGNGESVQGYFRKIFLENPKLLKSRSNNELLRRWLADHPEEKEVPQRIKSGLSNLKSVMRSKRRKKTAARSAQAAAAPLSANRPAPRLAPHKSKLETLEELIDECLTYSRTLDREGLEDVILHLRKARNAVVWKMGQ